MKQLLRQFIQDTDGQDLIEYALLAATISLGVTGAMILVKDALNTEYTNISNSVTAAS